MPLPNNKLHFDNNISLGHILVGISMFFTVVSAYFGLVKDVSIVTSAQAAHEQASSIQYRVLFQEIQELKQQIIILQQKLDTKQNAK